MKYLLGARDNTNFGTIKGARKEKKKKRNRFCRSEMIR